MLQAGQKTSGHVEQTPRLHEADDVTLSWVNSSVSLAFTRVSETTILGTSSLCDIISSKRGKSVCSLSVALTRFMWQREQMFAW